MLRRPGFIAYAVVDWYRFNGIGMVSIDPDAPRQNAADWLNDNQVQLA